MVPYLSRFKIISERLAFRFVMFMVFIELKYWRSFLLFVQFCQFNCNWTPDLDLDSKH
jgi:hypothetical protein